jgi:hypothetical protein
VLALNIIGSVVSGAFSGVKNLFGFSRKNNSSNNPETYTDSRGEIRQKIIADNEGEYVDFEEIKE